MSLFSYLDYRDYLRDFYHRQKSLHPWYSYRVFAEKAQLSSPNYLKLVIDRKRPITEKNLPLFIKGLSLNKREAKYFRLLVLFQESKNQDHKNTTHKKILELQRASQLGAELAQDRYEILSRWHHWVIREMILLKNFKLDGHWVAKKLNFLITPEEAEHSLKKLEQLGFFTREQELVKLSEPLICTSDGITSAVIRDLHAQFIELGHQALMKLPVEKRTVQGATIALPKEQIPVVSEKIKAFCREISEMFSDTYENDQVFHLTVNFFPLTQEDKK